MTGDATPPDAFRISVYAYTEGNPPGPLVWTIDASSFEMLGDDPIEFRVPLDLDVLAPGERHWIVGQAVACTPPLFAMHSGVGNGRRAYWRSENFGYPTWTELDAEVSFGVTFSPVDPTPLINSDWTSLKREYGARQSVAAIEEIDRQV